MVAEENLEQHFQEEQQEKDKNNIESESKSKYLIVAKKILKWIKKRKTTLEKIEQANKSLNKILIDYIEPYYCCKTEEERKKYKDEHPDFDEVEQTIDEIYRINNHRRISPFLINTIKIQRWMIKNNTVDYPHQELEDEEERELGRFFSITKFNLLTPYKYLKSEEEKKEYKEIYPEFEVVKRIYDEIYRNFNIYYIKKIQEWIKERNTVDLPNIKSEDKEERKLAERFKLIKKDLINPYYDIKIDEEREEYKKEHLEFEEIDQIIHEMYRNKYLYYAKKTLEWMQKNETIKQPSKNSKDEKERKLARELYKIRKYLLEPYNLLKTNEEREKYKKEHLEFDEVKQIIDEIERLSKIYNSPFYNKVIEVQEWQKKTNKTESPDINSKDEEERRHAKNLKSVKKNFLRLYDFYETDEERKIFKHKHPEYDIVRRIVDEIEGNKSKNLETLIKEDNEKRELLEEAKNLEAIYIEQLKGNRNIGDSNEQK